MHHGMRGRAKPGRPPLEALAHETLLQYFPPPLAPRSLLHAGKAVRLVQASRGLQAIEGPQVRFGEGRPGVHERERLGEQVAADTAAAHPVIHDEPAQVGDSWPEIFAVDGHRTLPHRPARRRSLARGG